MTTFDGRETAPAAATPDLFLGDDGKPLEFFDAVVGGRSVGVPGVPRLLETIHRRYGTRPWQSLFEPAIRLAIRASPSPRGLQRFVADDGGRWTRAGARAYFFAPDGSPLPAGTLCVNPDYAATLKARRDGRGRRLLQRSDRGKIVETVARIRPIRRPEPRRPGRLQGQGAAGGLRALSRPQVCGMGPPSSGAIADRPDSRPARALRHRHARPGRSGSLAADRRRHSPGLRRPRALRRRQRFRLDARGPARPGLSQGALPNCFAVRRRWAKTTPRPANRHGTRPNCASTASPSKCPRHRILSSSMRTATSPR